MGEEVKYKQESTRSLRAVLAVLVLGFCLAVAAVIVLAGKHFLHIFEILKNLIDSRIV